MNNKMKRTVFLLLAAMLTTALIKAQVTPMVLGDSHAMLKMEQGKKYVLLPVQESEDIASIAVLNNQNDMVQRLNVKLAIDRVDYYVPISWRQTSEGCCGRVRLLEGYKVLQHLRHHQP